jgi:glycogen(starch) synthase
MNVAIFASAFHPSVGGVEELVRQLAHEYRRQGMNVIVLTNRWPRSLPKHEIYEGIPVYRLAMRLPHFSLQIRVNYWLTHQAVRQRMLNILKEHSIDLVHVQCVSSNGHYALMAKHALGLPLILTAQGERTMDAGRVYETSAFQNQILRDLIDQADYITACSRDTLTDLEQYAGKSFGPRASVVYNGIRMDDFQGLEPYSHPRPYILGIGRLVPQKGFDILIQAFAEAALPTHDLLLAGEGPELPALESLAEKLGLAGRVHFMGRAARPLAVALFKGASFFVLPSRQEPMGIVNAEAMAAGKAVIASRTGGVPEIVKENETGLLVPPADVPALAEAIRRLGSDEPLRERMGAAGQVRALQFTWEVIARSYRDIYEEVIPKDAPRSAAHQPVQDILNG